MCQELCGTSLSDIFETRDVNMSENDGLTKDQTADGDKQQDAASSTGDDDGVNSGTAELYHVLTGAMCDTNAGQSGPGPGVPPVV